MYELILTGEGGKVLEQWPLRSDYLDLAKDAARALAIFYEQQRGYDWNNDDMLNFDTTKFIGMDDKFNPIELTIVDSYGEI